MINCILFLNIHVITQLAPLLAVAVIHIYVSKKNFIADKNNDILYSNNDSTYILYSAYTLSTISTIDTISILCTLYITVVVRVRQNTLVNKFYTLYTTIDHYTLL